jgi:hypothetical protein
MEIINKIIDSYPNEYLAIKEQAKKYILNGSNIDEKGRLNILHRPWVAPLNWGLMIYKGADKQLLCEFQYDNEINIPAFYREFLENINGCFLYDISLYGIIPSLTRSFLQCHSLQTANTYWKNEFKVDNSYFHFGGSIYNYEENVGYFYAKNKIISIRKNGKIVGEWNLFSSFLNDEIIRSEKGMLKEIPQDIKLIRSLLA